MTGGSWLKLVSGCTAGSRVRFKTRWENRQGKHLKKRWRMSACNAIIGAFKINLFSHLKITSIDLSIANLDCLLEKKNKLC